MDQRARAFGQSLVSRIDREPHGKPNIESTSPNDRQAALVDRGASRERLVSSGPPDRCPVALADCPGYSSSPRWSRRIPDRTLANPLLGLCKQ
jgi:hypothetical protein